MGEGTYGKVYRGIDRQTGESVAVKVIEKNHSANCDIQGFSVAIIREAAILKSLKHRNIIEMKDVVLSKKRAYIVTNLCYCDLRYFIHRLRGFGYETVDPTDLKSFMNQILAAVSYCHEQRILHRDLKPDNILLDRARKLIKVADFGMARRFVPQQRLTGNCVTTWYRCPEIMLGDPRYGAPADMWSVGCIFAEMINLRPLFECSTEVECLIAMFRVLGTPDERSWPGVSALPHYHPFFPNWAGQPLARLLLPSPAARLCPGALDFLGVMLRLDPAKRISARAALLDPFLSNSSPDEPAGGDGRAGLCGPAAAGQARGPEPPPASTRSQQASAAPPSAAAPARAAEAAAAAARGASGQEAGGERRRSKRICVRLNRGNKAAQKLGPAT